MAETEYIGEPDTNDVGERFMMARVQEGIEKAELSSRGGIPENRIDEVEKAKSVNDISVNDVISYAQGLGNITPGGMLNRVLKVGVSAPEARTTREGGRDEPEA